jgi:hypothetical protein
VQAVVSTGKVVAVEMCLQIFGAPVIARGSGAGEAFATAYPCGLSHWTKCVSLMHIPPLERTANYSENIRHPRTSPQVLLRAATCEASSARPSIAVNQCERMLTSAAGRTKISRPRINKLPEPPG